MEQVENRYKHKIITIPNMISFFRLCLIPLILWQYVGEKNYCNALYLLVLSGLTDIVDGIIARKFHMISDLGKALDPVADKLTQIAVLFCLVTRFPPMWIPLVLLLVKELFAGITGLMMVKRGTVIGADWHGKVTTVLLYGTMLAHLAWVNIPPVVSHILVILCTGMLLLSGILYGVRNLRFLSSGGAQYEEN